MTEYSEKYLLDAIIREDEEYVTDYIKIVLSNDIKIENPEYILILVKKLLNNDNNSSSKVTKLSNMIMMLYYVGYQTDKMSYIISSSRCDMKRKRLFEIELQYAIDTKIPVTNIWSRYENSIYANTYQHTFEKFLNKSIKRNGLWKDYFSYAKLLASCIFYCKDYRSEECI